MLKRIKKKMQEFIIVAAASIKKPYGATHIIYEPGYKPSYYRQSFCRLYWYNFDWMGWDEIDQASIDDEFKRFSAENQRAKLAKCHYW